MEQAKCPGCGLLVVKDDGAQTIVHEAPVCAWFDKAVRSVGEPEVREIRGEALPRHFAALREAKRRPAKQS